MADTKQNPTMELDAKYDHYDFPTTAPESKPGHPGHLSEGQQAQVHQLRLMLESEGYTKRLDTLSLLRFLRARKFDVNAAKTMFTDCEKWRQAMTTIDSKTGQPRPLQPDDKDPKPNAPALNLDELVATWDKDKSLKKTLSDFYPQFYHKTDKDGRPVYIEQLGKINLDELKNKYRIYEDKMLVNLAVEYEKMADPRLPACSRKAGQLLETCCTIMDLKDVGMSKASEVYPFIKKASTMSNNYNPERLGHMYLINLPWAFKWVWKVVSGFLDPVTVSKIHLLSSDYQKELLAQIPAENLPEEFGGKCRCEGGCKLSDAGPWREEQWSRPAWWEKDAGSSTIENKPTEVVGAGAPAAEGEVKIVGTEDKTPAPAIA
ncbi:CRAL-TRIO domain-containing protein [Xylariomycetidae sp. FL2044]|nr:CRAL-TRIO domain-containing protein [Xylariomycetidae sp. FL2044]